MLMVLQYTRSLSRAAVTLPPLCVHLAICTVNTFKGVIVLHTHRRHEVVHDAPMVYDFMASWPILFEVSEINAEFKRITTVLLQSKFLSQLDLYSDKLMRLFKKRGGQLGERLKRINAQLADGMDEDAIKEAIEDTTVGIYVFKDYASNDEPNDIGIVLEVIKVLQCLDNAALAVAMLFRLMYALNLNYPAKLC
ncbi:hypothetical protein QTP70_018140 [Hemibagrus guttatus]|uniref:Uncharacterized protein n=1 Tax=Hemibagrus guttatus TaxID=175788 RepID=A0AAE0QS29_9TELE|nr:hypothetical protein QTP70_018140 [Hemibagrus guttatus]